MNFIRYEHTLPNSKTYNEYVKGVNLLSHSTMHVDYGICIRYVLS